jgi:hypothetical protein
MAVDFWKSAADGFTFFAGYKILAGAADVIVGQPGELFGTMAFLAGAAGVAAILFVDFYVRETIE